MMMTSRSIPYFGDGTTDLGTILTAANWPVVVFLARRTLPEEPRPKVLPSLQGPTCAFVFLEEVVESCDRRLSSVESVDSRLVFCALTCC